MSASSWRAMIAFRILVSMSAMGSVIDMDTPLPTRFYYAGQFASQGQIPEADPANIELSHEAPRPAADYASLLCSAAEFDRLSQLFHHTLSRPASSTNLYMALNDLNGPERHTHQLQKLVRFLIRFCRRSDGDVHTPHLVDLVVFDLRKNNLLAQPDRVISSTIKRL